MAKVRLDQALVAQGLVPSREQAQRLILAGEVKIGTRIVTKASEKIEPDTTIELKEKPRFVSRGGLKLEGALIQFGIDVTGFIGLDVGSSTGGFTDCLLQRGATKVYAFDVGTNQLAWKLRSDPRVISRENFNCRHLRPDDVQGDPVRIAVMDLSFISLTLILPHVVPCLAESGSIVCLIKPQFELSPEHIGRGGIVREASYREQAVTKIRSWVSQDGRLHWRGLIESPITGTDGNVEYLAWLALA